MDPSFTYSGARMELTFGDGLWPAGGEWGSRADVEVTLKETYHVLDKIERLVGYVDLLERLCTFVIHSQREEVAAMECSTTVTEVHAQPAATTDFRAYLCFCVCEKWESRGVYMFRTRPPIVFNEYEV